MKVENREIGYTEFEAMKSLVDSDSNIQSEIADTVLDYNGLLNEVRTKITEQHQADLTRAINDIEATSTLKTLIEKYISQSARLKNVSDISSVAQRIYNDMAGFSVITDPLYDETVEEININGMGRGKIEIIRTSGTSFSELGFNSSEAAASTIGKMVLAGGLGALDGQHPAIDSYIGNGTRISALVPPIIRKEDGVVASIRRQRKNDITREEMIADGAATADILDFLGCCVCNSVSVMLVGGMGSGKTTGVTYLMNHYAKHNNDFNNRMYVIEDTREIEAIEWDEEHNRPARVIYTCVKPEPNPVTMRELVKKGLRFNPRVYVPAECRDEAAFDVVDAGNTGQTIITSLHAKNAKEAYFRLLSLCERANTGLSEKTLMHFITTALPISVFVEQQKDRTRRFAEIYEATGHKDGEVEGRLLFKYYKDDFIEDEHGSVTKVIGHFEKVNNISDGLREQMIDAGGKKVAALLERIFPTAEPKEGESQ